MNELVKSNNIENLIYNIRGVPVMLSSDVAKIYQVETKRVNEIIKRNIKRFPDTFCFQLTKEEIDNLSSRSQIATLNENSNSNYEINKSLRSQFATLNKSNNFRGLHYKYLPYVLTEQGVIMLSGLLKSDIAVEINIRVVNAFVKIRHLINDNLIDSEMLLNHENRILKLEEIFNKLNKNNKINTIFYNGQIYDAYSKILEIFKFAKNSLIIIDSYADNKVLDMISRLNVNVIIITKDSNRISSLDIEKYNSQYNNLTIIRNNTFHDRYVIIDKKEVYHLGTSINNAGNGTFSINKLEDEDIISFLINKIKLILDK